MVARRSLKEEPAGTPRRRSSIPAETKSYFASKESKNLEWVSSGCSLMDCVLGGGYVLGRMVNIVGDKSTGKTLLAIEASANFKRSYPDGVIRYTETEAAFDEGYAEALGMPTGCVDFATGIRTVEEFFEDLEKTLKELNGRPGLYILDSLDALSDKAEQERKIDDGSYGGSKPKKLGELFRRMVKQIEESRLLLVVISQIRDKIGVTFGERHTRSGGKALDFYASHIIWLHELQKLKRTISNVERVYGISIRAKCKKNKVGLPFRECDMPIIFGYGVDDLTAGVEWLLEIKRDDLVAELGMSKAGYKVRINNLRSKGGAEAAELRSRIASVVRSEWEKIETSFLPAAKKY